MYITYVGSVVLLGLPVASIDPGMRDFPHLWIFQSILLNLVNPSPSHVNMEVDTASKQGSSACGLGL